MLTKYRFLGFMHYHWSSPPFHSLPRSSESPGRVGLVFNPRIAELSSLNLPTPINSHVISPIDIHKSTWHRKYLVKTLFANLDCVKLKIKTSQHKQKILTLILLWIITESGTMCFDHVHPPTTILPKSTPLWPYPLKITLFTFINFQDQFMIFECTLMCGLPLKHV